MSIIARLGLVALLSLPLTGTACALEDVGETRDEGIGQSADALSRAKHHYASDVSGVHFSPGCGVVADPPQADCTYGFVVDYRPSYVDLTTAVTHSVDNTTHTLTITLDGWSYSVIHPDLVPEAETDDLGTLGTKVGHTYAVKVVDHAEHVLWSGHVASLYHL